MGQKTDLEGLNSGWWGGIIADIMWMLIICLELFQMHLMCFASFNTHNNPVKKLRHREAKCLAQGHTARRQHSWDCNSGTCHEPVIPRSARREKSKQGRKGKKGLPFSPRTEEQQKERTEAA